MEKEYGPVTLIWRGLESFSSVMPCTSRKVTQSPSWNPCLLSWWVTTAPGFSLLTPATIALLGSSPSLSKMVKESP